MRDRIRATIDRSLGSSEVPELKGVSGMLCFDLAEAGSWAVRIDDGRVHVQESSAEGDCTIRCDEGDFLRILSGEQNLVTCALQGRLHVDGDLQLVQRFHGLIRARTPRVQRAPEQPR